MFFHDTAHVIMQNNCLIKTEKIRISKSFFLSNLNSLCFSHKDFSKKAGCNKVFVVGVSVHQDIVLSALFLIII